MGIADAVTQAVSVGCDGEGSISDVSRPMVKPLVVDPVEYPVCSEDDAKVYGTEESPLDTLYEISLCCS